MKPLADSMTLGLTGFGKSLSEAKKGVDLPRRRWLTWTSSKQESTTLDGSRNPYQTLLQHSTRKRLMMRFFKPYSKLDSKAS